jgi:hypothetical protein
MGGWYDRDRGKLPINWGMNPFEATDMPAHVAHFYETATPNDYFYSGVGGAGYVFLNRLKDPQAYIRHAARHLARGGMDVIETWHNGKPARNWYDDYARSARLRGMVHLPDGPAHVELLPSGMPIVFMDPTLVHYEGTAEQVADRIRAIADRGPLPAFVPVYNSPEPDVAERFRRIAACLDPDRFELVRLDVMMRLAKAAKQKER